MTARIILTTVATERDANHVARDLVDNRFAACVNIVPGLRSVYRWRGVVNEDPELLLLIKTTAEKVEPLRERLRTVHPYELPEFVVISPESLSPEYAAWIEESTQAVRRS